ncbi:MAG: AbrB/MazE/SpoVT family DNA-binding domain-containing protein [Spirochaetes bacterium]|jgi:AbrB family looped-hinge helix DNA binding protein|nr:AbrB/MazE/SpoVT family DNA-binding domain-containing protein [Spirochaetota bacterium]
MDVTIDSHGRIVIPKAVRERLDLRPGAVLTLTIEPAEDGEALRLRPPSGRPALLRKDGVLVHTGMSDEALDPSKSVRRARAERTRDLSDPDAS